jgi:hypothetical protein
MVDRVMGESVDQPSALLRLQEIDLAIARAERALDELPEKKAILDIRAKQREVQDLAAKAELLVGKIEAEIKRSQDDTDMVQSKAEEEQAKLMTGTVTDHKQVQHISREIDALRRRKDKLEMDTLKLMERLEKAEGQRATVDKALVQLAEREAVLVDRFREHGGELQSTIAANTARRESVAASLDPDLLERYISLREVKAGIGVGRLEGDSCSACRIQLPAESVATLLAGPDIGVCAHCHRLIVVRASDEQ